MNALVEFLCDPDVLAFHGKALGVIGTAFVTHLLGKAANPSAVAENQPPPKTCAAKRGARRKETKKAGKARVRIGRPR